MAAEKDKSGSGLDVFEDLVRKKTAAEEPELEPEPSPEPAPVPAASAKSPASVPGPLPPVTAPPSRGAPPVKPAVVDMDWDDNDEEQTQDFDGAPAPSAAAKLLARSGSVAPPMPKLPAPMPAPAAVPAVPGPRPSQVDAARVSAPAISQQPTPKPAPAAPPAAKSSNTVLVAVALLGLLAVVIGLGYYFTRESTGTLKVYVSGPGGRELSNVVVFVNGKKECNSSPCTVEKLTPGIHDVKAGAEGYQTTASKGVTITAGDQSKIDLELQLASAGTGFRVDGKPTGIKLFVDGKEVGTLPQSLVDLSPGSHALRFAKDDRYQTLEKTVNVVPDKVEDLGTVTLGVIKGRATFELQTRGVLMTLVSSDGKKERLDEAKFKDGKHTMDLDATKQWQLEVTKLDHEDLTIQVSFEDGEGDKTFPIKLREKQKPGEKKGDGSADKPPVPGGQAKLNIGSIPPAAVLLNGRPIGRTPKGGVSVPPGTHVLTFIHPDLGRKTASVTVKAGETKAVGVRF